MSFGSVLRARLANHGDLDLPRILQLALDPPLRVVVQSELVANEPGRPPEPDPRAAAVLEAPLESEEFLHDDTRVVLVHTTRRSKLRMAAALDHVVEGPEGTTTIGEAAFIELTLKSMASQTMNPK